MSDSLSSYETIPGGSRPFIPKAQREHVDGEHVYLMVPQRRFTSGRTRLNAYDFKKPSAMMATEAYGIGDYEHFGLERYDYPGKYVEPDAGTGYASAEMNAEAGRDRRRMVGGDLPSACPGQLMEVTGHPRAAENQDYLILSATHAFAAQGYRSGVNDEDAYHGTYELLPATSDYTPPQATEKARVYGPQTAVVVGEGEIDVDEYGRILVRFHWDRLKDQSRRCRVSQNWASKGWGGMIIPRIGMEVIVDFLEGDPDEPIVTGCVYHAQNMPAYPLPANKTKSVFRTDAHRGQGFNELSFEDEKGREEIFIQAQKDLHIGVKNNFVQFTNAHSHEQIGMNDTKVVLGWADYYYNQNLNLSTGRNFFQMIGEPDAVMSVMSTNFVSRYNFNLPFSELALHTDLDKSHNQGSLVSVVAGDVSTTVGLHYTLTVSGNAHATFENGFSSISGKDHTVAARNNLTASAGTHMIISAGEALVFKCGKSEITMTKKGDLTINGKNIKMRGDKIELN